MSAIYTGTLMHQRVTPREHRFSYDVQYFLLDLDELPELERRLRLFSVNRRNVVSFYDRDHFGVAGTAKDGVLRLLGDRGIHLAGGQILMLTQLRVLGYVFNPVTFFYCYDAAGALAGIVSELNNTFGESLPEVLSPANQVDAPNGRSVSYEHDKRLHVSPFFGLDYRYRYFFSPPEERLLARIDVLDADGSRPLHAVLNGTRQPLTNATLAGVLLRYPLMPVKVIALIHWQALKLFLKRVPFHHKPPFEPGKGSFTTS